MAAIVFFGGEAEAAGWRLAGVRAVVAPAATRVGEAFEAACADAQLVLLDAATAARLPPTVLATARAAGRALPCVLPAATADAVPDPVVGAARRQLGMDE